MLVDVALVLDQLALQDLLEVTALRPQIREPVDHVLDQVEPVEAVLRADVERRRYGALLLVVPDVQVVVRAAVGEAVDQPWVAVKAEDDVLVLGEQLEQLPEPSLVPADVRVNFAVLVGALEIGIGDQRRPAVARTGNIEYVEVICAVSMASVLRFPVTARGRRRARQ